MADRRRASCPCPGERRPSQFDTTRSRLLESAQRRYTYSPGQYKDELPSTGTYTRELSYLSTPPRSAQGRTPQPNPAQRVVSPESTWDYTPDVLKDTPPRQLVTPPRNAQGAKPQPDCAAPKRRVRRGWIRINDIMPLPPELKGRDLAQEFQEVMVQSEQEQQPVPSTRLSGRWRNDAASTVDDFRSQRELIQSRRANQLYPSEFPEIGPPVMTSTPKEEYLDCPRIGSPIMTPSPNVADLDYPRIGPPLMTSTPNEAYLATMATVGPPLDPGRLSMSPIPRGSLMNETVTQVRGVSQASGRRVFLEADNISRQQRQVSFDVPVGKGKSRKEKKVTALSALKRFDRDATAELKKRRQLGTERGMAVLQETGGHQATRPSAGKQPRSTVSMSAKSSMSAREIGWLLRDEPDTELMEAVEKLAQAEAAVVYDGAVRAAEEAAAKAPPELAEEAAAAGARTYRAEITHSVQEILTGEKPIEIIGYVGMTRPREM